MEAAVERDDPRYFLCFAIQPQHTLMAPNPEGHIDIGIRSRKIRRDAGDRDRQVTRDIRKRVAAVGIRLQRLVAGFHYRGGLAVSGIQSQRETEAASLLYRIISGNRISRSTDHRRQGDRVTVHRGSGIRFRLRLRFRFYRHRAVNA